MSEKSAELLMNFYNEHQPEELALCYSEWLVYEELNAFIKDAGKLVLFDNFDGDKQDTSVKQLNIFGRTIDLQISDAVCTECLKQSARKTSDELSADCEPSGIEVWMIISRHSTQIRCWHAVMDHP